MDKMRTKCSSTLLIEDEKVRVTRFDFNPGQETGWHEHAHDYVITAITSCKMMLENADGTKSTAEIKAGNAYSRTAGVRHNVINSSEKLMTFIEIELKN
jgi:quercetin dioxygenase-like cupin family protein